MTSRSFRAALGLAAVLMFTACQGVRSMGTEPASPQQQQPVPGFVTDSAAFDSFIAGKPTPQQFRTIYPDVTLVLPGDIATKEFRSNRSRYFADLDESGRIVGGRFM
jgi:hypothetical protein